MSRTNNEGAVLTRKKSKIKEPPMYRVLLLNDDYTTQEFVVMVLEHVFGKGQGEAQAIMMKVHMEGKAQVGIYTKEIAEMKVAIVHHLARQEEFPLKATMEPVS